MENWLVGLVGEFDVFEAHRALDGRHLDGAARGLVLLELGHDFVGAIEAGKGFSELRADVHNLEDRRDHEGQEDVVLEIVADRPRAVENSCAAQPHHQSRDQPEHGGGGRAKDAGHGKRLHHVLQKAVDTLGKDRGFAVFGVVALDDAHAAQRFSEPARDLGVDFAAFAEDGADAS